uniref:Uncharacterized protein n=1 Tax=Meloidogyne javanica TaxID=6303 RepID=A0A915N5F2_MELJA
MKISLYPFRPVMCTSSDLIQAEIYQETYVTSNVYNVLTITQIWFLVMPKLSFSAVDIDSFITVPTLLMYVAASGKLDFRLKQ